METTTKRRRINQFVYIHYENARLDGHLITLMDSFRNKLGKIYEIKNDETGKREYAFRDADGNEICKKGTVGELKEEIATRKAVMLEQAHQRRIQHNAEKAISQSNPFKQKGQKKTILPPAKDVESIVEKTVNESRDVLKAVHEFAGGEDREAEMQEIRERKGQNKKRDLGR